MERIEDLNENIHEEPIEIGSSDNEYDEEDDENTEHDHDEISERNLVEQALLAVADNPRLFSSIIDTVNLLGVAGERRNIGLYSITMDSSLIISPYGSESLASINIGHQGAGKSETLNKLLLLRPQSMYYILSNSTAKGLYNMRDSLKHRTLIFAEDFPLKKEGEVAHLVRLMISEGKASHQRSIQTDEGWRTEEVIMQGPISVVSTTVFPQIEEQLGDRLIKMYPDVSEEQTRRVLRAQAHRAAGMDNVIDERTLKVWRLFYDLLEPYQVIVPFAPEINRFLETQRQPISARRAFSRILSGIKTLAILYQRQRNVDENGRLIADMPDYYMTRQLLNSAFIESIRGSATHTESRMQTIQDEGKLTISNLASREYCSASNISQWAKSQVEAGNLAWCDEMNNPFENVNDLKKAKYRGKAFLCIPNCHGLPTPYELTNDPSWNRGGELYQLYDLELDSIKELNTLQENYVLQYLKDYKETDTSHC